MEVKLHNIRYKIYYKYIMYGIFIMKLYFILIFMNFIENE